MPTIEQQSITMCHPIVNRVHVVEQKMPAFKVLTDVEIANLTAKDPRETVDLSEYVAFLDTVPANHGGELTLDAGDMPRTIKRRLTGAAKLTGRNVTYLRSTDKRTIRFTTAMVNKAPRKAMSDATKAAAIAKRAATKAAKAAAKVS